MAKEVAFGDERGRGSAEDDESGSERRFVPERDSRPVDALDQMPPGEIEQDEVRQRERCGDAGRDEAVDAVGQRVLEGQPAAVDHED